MCPITNLQSGKYRVISQTVLGMGNNRNTDFHDNHQISQELLYQIWIRPVKNVAHINDYKAQKLQALTFGE